jgi:hypothetical protein
MRFLYVILAALLILPVTAQAGQLTSDNGRGRWVSTECQAPVSPQSLQKEAETKANNLNADVTAHNAFAADARKYMECISAEAERDAQAMGKMIVDDASEVMQSMSDKVKSSADSLRSK